MSTSTASTDNLFSNLPFWVFVILAWVTWRLVGNYIGIVYYAPSAASTAQECAHHRKQGYTINLRAWKSTTKSIISSGIWPIKQR